MIRQCRTPKRREFLTGITAVSAATIVSSTLQNQALAGILSTPPQTEGPFYPVLKPLAQDADLTMVGNSGKRAAGDLLLVQGKVLTPNDSPVTNALVEIWQTNAWGRYQDRRDRSAVPWDQNFQGYGHVTTDANGAYAFRTIRPAGYGQGYFRRTPHIHFRISGHHFDRLTTQMYFAGEPETANDGPLNRISDSAKRQRLIVDLQQVQEQETRMWRGLFNIVLGKNLT